MKKILFWCIAGFLFISTVLAACSGGGGGGTAGGNGNPGGAPEPKVSPMGTKYTWDNSTAAKLEFTKPDGLQLTRDGSDGRITMEREWGTPGAYDYGQCKIALVHVTNTSNTDIDTLAINTLKQAFLTEWPGSVGNIFNIYPSSWIDLVATASYGNATTEFVNVNSHHTGMSGEGWSYVDLRGVLRQAPVGSPSYYNPAEEVRILMAQLDGNNYAAMIGYTFKDMYPPIRCLDDVSSYVASDWISLIHSLSFPDYHAPDPDVLRKAVTGSWTGSEIGSSISLYWSYVFATNGHSLEVRGNSQYQQMPGSGDIYEITSTWLGNGRWQLNGKKLTIWPDDTSQQPQTRYIRYHQEGNGGFTYLHMLDQCTSTINGVETPVLCEGWSTKD